MQTNDPAAFAHTYNKKLEDWRITELTEVKPERKPQSINIWTEPQSIYELWTDRTPEHLNWIPNEFIELAESNKYNSFQHTAILITNMGMFWKYYYRYGNLLYCKNEIARRI